METNTLNATLDCIKETTTFTGRIITNVCTGQVTTIPIGFWEFVGIIGLAVFLIPVILLMYIMAQDIINN